MIQVVQARSNAAAARLRVAALVAALLVNPAMSRAGQPAYTNRLTASADPYLLLHAHNPVDWYPWGPEAFAKAKAEGKPIFLSIGYSTCYWCHVAEKTIYSDPAIAALMNKWFFNVKVDREQRPDVDKLYIVATEMLTQHGAWPNNLFLTPDGKPFYAGSYFPPKDDGDTPGFPKVLAAIHDLWENHRAEKVDPAANELYEALRRVAAKQLDAKPAPVEPRAWLKQATAILLKSVDPVNGGLGNPKGGPKFPQAPALDLLLAARTLDRDRAAGDALAGTLEAMGRGGIHDQLGGGFHRYATEPTWTLPHFEKMLSDNAQLLSLYARAYALDKSPYLADVARDTADYLLREMQAPSGGFYTAQDAEIAGVEGADYLWTQTEIETVLGPDAAKNFFAAYEIAAMLDPTPAGGVLRVRKGVAAAALESLAPERAKLLAVRRARPQPLTDKKIVTGLNGLAIGALARASMALEAPELTDAATKAAETIWAKAFDAKTGALSHEIIGGTADGDGYVEDYAMLGEAFLDLASADQPRASNLALADNVWADRAAALADAMLTRFAGADGRLATSHASGLPIALGDNSDEDAPSGTSAALALLARLGERPGGARFAAAAAKLAVATSGQIAPHPAAWPSAVAALARHPIAPRALAAAEPRPAAQAAESGAPPAGGPATADHVHASAKVEGDRIAVTVAVDPGYHINAHKPSFDYLVPTDLSFAGLKPTAIAYPPAVAFRSGFAKDALSVYEGDVPVVATFEKGALSGIMGVEGKLTTQACDARTCLPPATIPISVANPG